MSKRFFVILFFGSVVAFTAIWATIGKDEAVAVVGLGIIGGIITFYLHSETKRPSNKNKYK